MNEARFISAAVERLFDEAHGLKRAEVMMLVRDFVSDEAPPNFNTAGVIGRIVAKLRGEAEPAAVIGSVAAHIQAGPVARPKSGTGYRPLPEVNLHKSPYRFVSIPEGVVPAPLGVQPADIANPLANGLSGGIEVEWAVETPLLIGVDNNGVDTPMMLGNDYVIPGATLRGMTRSAMEIICRARLTQVNAHHKYPLRDFVHSRYKDRTNTNDIRAGWLERADIKDRTKGYTLTPCRYSPIKIRDLPSVVLPRAVGGMVTGNQHLAWLRAELGQKYANAGMVGRSGTFQFGSTEFVFVPKPNSNEVVPGFGQGDDGVLVFAGPSPALTTTTGAQLDAEDQLLEPRPGQKKKREYVFFDLDDAKPLPVRTTTFERFELMNTVPSRHKRQPVGSYAVLAPTLESGRRIPVFYTGDLVGDQSTLEIGLTKLFKISHDYSVGAKLGKETGHQPNPTDPDMVEALFGHVFEQGDLGLAVGTAPPREAARKGRIGFGFATLTNPQDATTRDSTLSAVMMGPRASFAPFYLKGTYKDWSDPDSRLAGRKRYFPRFADRAAQTNSARDIAASLRAVPGTDATSSRLTFLRPNKPNTDLVFCSTIRLHNVLPEEVGALLWVLTHGGDPAKPYRHMIGRAKNAGAGQTRVKSVTLKLERNDGQPVADVAAANTWETSAAGATPTEGWTAVGSQSLTPFLQAFDTFMKRETRAADWPRVTEIQEFLGCSTPQAALCPPPTQSPYPALGDFAAIRKTTKHDHGRVPPNAGATDRYLTTPCVAAADVKTPYV
jgi:CRISPR-associated protein (TIGR03986 family)